MVQEIITLLIVAGAIGYVVFKTVQLVRKKPAECKEESPGCRGCQLKESCKLTSPKYH